MVLRFIAISVRRNFITQDTRDCADYSQLVEVTSSMYSSLPHVTLPPYVHKDE